MKKFLSTASAAALILGVAAPASAQSVLERVLAQTESLGDVTGVFSNSADNIGGFATQSTYTLSDAAADALGVTGVGSGPNDGSVTITEAQYLSTIDVTIAELQAGITENPDGTFTVSGSSSTPGLTVPSNDFVTRAAAEAYAEQIARAFVNANVVIDETTVYNAGSIDGSITNVATRIDQATANVDDQVTAISNVDANFGNMATTVLGAVNTGEIGLGTNQVVEEALAGSSEAIRSTVEQIGTITGTTQLAVNSALNTMSIDGSISNTLTGVNGSVAAISPDQLDIGTDTDGAITIAGLDQLLGSMETTVLGAVNTGTIVSGVNNQVEGAVAGIVGNSATNMFAEAAAPAETDSEND